ncbi:hypothetical protein HanIR_Chr14g0726551 [Helianthus annuus]|nr:hypothetical protein HanIR_Chr14g0726551 [Helianthus annuus]
MARDSCPSLYKISAQANLLVQQLSSDGLQCSLTKNLMTIYIRVVFLKKRMNWKR